MEWFYELSVFSLLLTSKVKILFLFKMCAVCIVMMHVLDIEIIQ
jgi:hypothetical protein